MCAEKASLDYEIFILEFCENITKVLFINEPKRDLSNEDIDFVKKIYDYREVDNYIFSEKARTDFEVYIYSECHRYVNERLGNPNFDIGSGIDLINNAYTLLSGKYKEDYKTHFPQTLTNIKDLIIIKLSTVDVASKHNNSVLQRKTINERLRSIRISTDKLSVATEDLEKKTNTLTDKLDETISKNSEFSKDIISIISIFAAIVLTMAGVFSFTSAVLENISSANIWCLSIVVLIFGIIFLTVFLGLFYFLYNVRHDVDCYRIKSDLNALKQAAPQSQYIPIKQKLSDQERKLVEKENEIDRKLSKNRKFLLIPFIVSICLMLALLIGIIALVLVNDELTFDSSAKSSECTCDANQQNEAGSVETSEDLIEQTETEVVTEEAPQ